jgi:hypothetical protein
MTKYFVYWKAVNSRIPEDREAKIKRSIGFLQIIQEALKSGPIKAYGTRPDNVEGYVIFEGSETDMARMATMFVPDFEFEVYPILTADEMMEVLKSA